MIVKELKKSLVLFASVFGMSLSVPAQDTTQSKYRSERQKWFIALPLRFTHLQDNNTMLSGIKAGRIIHPGWSVAVSVYHSFYLNSFKPKANLNGFTTQPRLFINGVGLEVQYDLYTRKAFNTNLQFLAGWGFMKYDLDDHNFRSRPANYLAIEPSVTTEYYVARSTVIGIGVGYRPVWGQQVISYTSAVSNGKIPVSTALPNGFNVLLTMKGYL